MVVGKNLDMRALLLQAWTLFFRAPTFYLSAGALLLLALLLTAGVLFVPLMLGLVHSIYAHERGTRPQLESLLSGAFRHAPAAMLLAIMIALMVLVGAVFIILPGLGVAFVFSLAPVALALSAEDTAGLVDRVLSALRVSMQVTRAHMADSLLLFIGVLAMNMVGTLFVAGLLFSLPFSIMVMTLAFKSWDNNRA